MRGSPPSLLLLPLSLSVRCLFLPEDGRRRRGLQQPLDRSQTPPKDAPGRGRRGGRRRRRSAGVEAAPLQLVSDSRQRRGGKARFCRFRRSCRPALEPYLEREGDDARREHRGDVARPGGGARRDREQQGTDPVAASEGTLLRCLPPLLLLRSLPEARRRRRSGRRRGRRRRRREDPDREGPLLPGRGGRPRR